MKMKLYRSNALKGTWLNAEAITMGRNRKEAAQFLADELEAAGIGQAVDIKKNLVKIETVTVEADSPQAIILWNGEY